MRRASAVLKFSDQSLRREKSVRGKEPLCRAESLRREEPLRGAQSLCCQESLCR
jgi:hypothetical protein